MRNNLIYYIVALFEVWFMSGTIYGWSSMVLLLKQENQYLELCAPGETSCSQQDLRFNLIFTLSTAAMTLMLIVSGTICDRFGIRMTRLFSCITTMLGTLMIAFSNTGTVFDAFMPGFIFMAAGGAGMFITHFQLANLTEKYKGLFLSLLSGSFDCSPLVFYFMHLLSPSLMNHRIIFLGYTTIILLITLNSFCMWPKISWPANQSMEIEGSVSVEPSFKSQLRSTPFWVLNLAYSTLLLRLNFYFSSVTEQIANIDPNQANQYTNYFNWIILSVLVTIWCIGYIINSHGLGYGLLSVAVFGSLFNISACIPQLELQLFTFWAIITTRGFYFACQALFLVKFFGYQHLGKLVGVSGLIASAISSFQYLLFWIAVEISNGNFLWVNLFLFFTSLLMFYCTFQTFRLLHNEKEKIVNNNNNNSIVHF